MSHNAFKINNKTAGASGALTLESGDFITGTPAQGDALGYSAGAWRGVSLSAQLTHEITISGRYNTNHVSTSSNPLDTSTKWAFIYRVGGTSQSAYVTNTASFTTTTAVSPPASLTNTYWRMNALIPSGRYLVRASVYNSTALGDDGIFRPAISSNSDGSDAAYIGPAMRAAGTNGRFNSSTAFVLDISSNKYLWFKLVSGTADIADPRNNDLFFLSICSY